ncbi:MAG: nuclease-related domain-containing protein [Woeseiaceae bacterium]
MMDFEGANWIVPLLAIVLLLVIWFVYRRFFSGGNSLDKALAEIGYHRIEALIIPSADEGEIQVDQLLLTSHGLLILEVKDVQGAVFGSDKMQDWTVIAEDRRFTFPNPQPALYDRVAAVKQIVRQVPVAGRVVFLEGAEFMKGTPSLVCNLEQLVAEFGEPDKSAAKFKIEAFKPHWELIQKAASQRSAAHSGP